MEEAAWETYKQFGVAGLFITMYLTTVWFLIRQLLKRGDEISKDKDKTLEIIVKNTESNDAVADALKHNTETMRNLVTFLEAKEKFERRRRDDSVDS